MQEVWDRIAAQGEGLTISDAMKSEVERRLAAHRADPAAAVPWEQVKAEALARLAR